MTDNELLRMLWRGRYLVVVSLVLSIGAAYAVTTRLPRVYQASGIVQVQPGDTTQASPGDLPALQQVSQGLAASYATLLDSSAFLQRLESKEPGTPTLYELQSNVSASAMTVNNSTTNLIRIVATGPTSQAAVKLARYVSNSFVALIRSDADARASAQRVQLTSQIDALSQRIASLRVQSGSAAAEQVQSLTTARAALAGQLASVVANQITAGQSVNVAALPTADPGPISPHPSLNLVIGALLGLLAGVGLAWVRDRIDTGLESSAQAEALLGVPSLATIPRTSPDLAPSGDYFTKEAYEFLRASFSFLAVEHDLRIVTITSHNPGEGKTSAATGLATAAVHSGLRVLVVDGDLRTSELSQRLQPGEARLPGLTNLVLKVSGSLRDAGPAARIPAAEIAEYIVPLQHNLSLLPAGITPPNPASFLSSPAVGDVFEALRDDFDLVIVDSPPVSHLADAALLAAHSDGVILVARIGVAKRSDLSAASSALRHLPTPVVGCVVFADRPAVGEQYYGVRPPGSEERPRRLVGRLRRRRRRPAPAERRPQPRGGMDLAVESERLQAPTGHGTNGSAAASRSTFPR